MRVVYGVVACAQVYAIMHTRCQVHKIKNNHFGSLAKVCECGYILDVHMYYTLRTHLLLFLLSVARKMHLLQRSCFFHLILTT